MGKHIKWKLKFRFEQAQPDQVFTCQVQPSYHFRGRLFTFNNPECFNIRGFQVGKSPQFTSTADVPCVVLNNIELPMEIAQRSLFVSLEIVNSSDRALSFFAELHGIALLGDNETPIKHDWEDFSTI